MDQLESPVAKDNLPTMKQNLNLEQAVVAGGTEQYYLTPCNHKFHKQCLLEWMEKRLQCPVCREPLPPPDPPEIDTDSD